jgi:TRAP-type C4-dicarboxylate transport system permease small subunit
MQSLKRLYQWIIRVEEALAGALMVAIAVLVFAAAIARFVGRPWNWAMDMSTFLFAWAVFLAADASMRNDRHPNVDLFVKKLPKKAQAYIELLNYLLIAAFLVCLIYYGIVMSYRTRFRAYQGIPGFSYTWATLSVPVGSALVLISTIIKIRQMIDKIRGKSA